MHLVRTFVWIIITAVLVGFVFMNLTSAPVNIWPLQTGYLHFDWPVGVIALVFFWLGLVPMYLLHRAQGWRMRRRISSLENTVRATAISPPLAATTLEADRSAVMPERYEP